MSLLARFEHLIRFLMFITSKTVVIFTRNKQILISALHNFNSVLIAQYLRHCVTPKFHLQNQNILDIGLYTVTKWKKSLFFDFIFFVSIFIYLKKEEIIAIKVFVQRMIPTIWGYFYFISLYH